MSQEELRMIKDGWVCHPVYGWNLKVTLDRLLEEEK
jgi:hypothetical protein